MVNKIIFVKSGGFSHQEFSLSGNIHFSGPNGFGKTTLLKAVLFAYSGESEDLGNQWRNFLFPHPDSMILYEMGSGKNAFTLCVSKVDASLEMLLVKGIYEQEIFITGAHQPNSMNLILKNIKKRKLDYVDQLKNGEDYRRIIFGQEEGKNKSLYRKFVLFESQKANLIIESQRDMIQQNDWSVSVLKDRIAKLALSDSQRINIGMIRESLKEFLKHWKSIESYRNNREMIPEIGLIRSQIEKYQSETKSLVRDLMVGFEDGKNALKALKKEIADLQKEKQHASSSTTLLKNEQIQLLETVLFQKARLTYQLDQLTEKQNICKFLDVQSLKASAACLPLLEEKKREIFSRIKGLEPKTKGKKPEDFLQYQEQITQQEFDNQRLSKREKIITESWQHLDQLEGIFQQKINELTHELNDLDTEIGGLKSKAFHIRREGIAELPGEQNSDRIIKLEEEFYRLSIEKERSQNRLTQLQSQKEIEAEEIARKEAGAKEEHKEKVLNLSQRIAQSKSEISDLRGSFQDWLGKNYPDWEKTIGKICRPEVLRNPYLGPEIERLNELFFGIRLDLDEVEPEIRSN
ncbi:MAG: ATP-binding protein, partial [Bacteroidetes bacterium]|nr:ATP-binding protein [Bacteroidota bacterium]